MLEAAHANLATKFVGSYDFQFPFIFFMCVQNPGRFATVIACVHQVSQVQQLLALAAPY
jgi:hypothetical protein